VREAGRFGKSAETGDVLVAYAYPDEMPKTPQPVDSKPHWMLVERQSCSVRANKPKALSTSNKRKAASVKDARAALAVLFNKTPPCPPVASHQLTLVSHNLAFSVTTATLSGKSDKKRRAYAN
jgi:hypothetical protein